VSPKTVYPGHGSYFCDRLHTPRFLARNIPCFFLPFCLGHKVLLQTSGVLCSWQNVFFIVDPLHLLIAIFSVSVKTSRELSPQARRFRRTPSQSDWPSQSRVDGAALPDFSSTGFRLLEFHPFVADFAFSPSLPLALAEYSEYLLDVSRKCFQPLSPPRPQLSSWIFSHSCPPSLGER